MKGTQAGQEQSKAYGAERQRRLTCAFRGQRVVGKEAAKQAGAKQGATDALGAQNTPSGGECGGRCPVPTSATLFLPLDSPGTLLLGSPEPDGSCWSVLKEGL